jgi:hypothetical protein
MTSLTSALGEKKETKLMRRGVTASVTRQRDLIQTRVRFVWQMAE